MSNFKDFRLLVLSLVLLISMTGSGAYAATLSQDTDGYYQISSATDLSAFATLVNTGDTLACARLTADITLTDNYSSIIGKRSSAYKFAGTFDGDGHTITGLTLSGGQYIGLFGYTGKGAVIKNLGLVNVNISATSATYAYSAALVGRAGGAITIENCYVSGGEVKGSRYLGGLIGRADTATVVTKCYNTAAITSHAVEATGGYKNGKYAGGLIGYQSKYEADLSYCYNAGTVTIDSLGGGLIGYKSMTDTMFVMKSCYNYGTVQRSSDTSEASSVDPQVYISSYNTYKEYVNISKCYYLSSLGKSRYGVGKTEEQFKSGAVCFLLNNESTSDVVWYQDLSSTDNKYPLLTGSSIVYPEYNNSGCTPDAYNNTATVNEKGDCTYDTDSGACTACDKYQPATLGDDGVYQIGNVGQLKWFASLVNGDDSYADFTAQNKAACAVLLNDISLSTADITYDTTDTTTPTTSNFSPIGNKAVAYTGTFDGQGYAVKNLTLAELQYLGLFGKTGSGAVIQNVGVEDVNIAPTANTYSYSAGLVAYVSGTTTIENCYVSGKITGVQYLGGLVSYSSGKLTMNKCYNLAEVSGTTYVAGLVGRLSLNTTQISNSYNFGAVTGTSDYVAGLVGFKNQSSINFTLESSFKAGTVTATSSTSGPIVGYIKNSTSDEDGEEASDISSYVNINYCYYLSDDASGDYGENKTENQFKSGEVCYLLNKESSKEVAWGQVIEGTEPCDDYPVLDSESIVYAACTKNYYTNSKSGHYVQDDGTCKFCGKICIDLETMNADVTAQTANAEYVVYGIPESELSNNISLTASGVSITLESIEVDEYTGTSAFITLSDAASSVALSLTGANTYTGSQPFVSGDLEVDGEGSLTLNTTNCPGVTGTVSGGASSAVVNNVIFEDTSAKDAVISFNGQTVNSATYTRSVSYEYTTLALPFACEIPEGVTIYKVAEDTPTGTSKGETVLYLEEETDGIVANTGYIMYIAELSGSIEVTFEASENVEIASTAESAPTECSLVPVWSYTVLPATGSTSETSNTVNGIDGSCVYKLAVDTSSNPYDYFFNHSAGAAAITPFRAWLYVPAETSSSAPQRLTISFGGEDEETTIVINAECGVLNAECEGVFNLQGQKVSADYKGIVIKNGRKVLVR